MSEQETKATAAEVIQRKRRVIVGHVKSSKMDKTIVVQAARLQKHPKYGKFYQVYKSYKAHDEKNECEDGDLVEIIESQPISKQKSFRLQRIVEKVKKAS